MSSLNQTAPRSRMNYGSVMLLVVLALAVLASGWLLVVVSTSFQAPPSDFTTIPSTPISRSGVAVSFSQVSNIASQGVTTGVSGYLLASSGGPVAGATVYVTYYFEGSYRTQVTVTDSNGYFEFHFHMNWTGWLPITLSYLGDMQHKGLTQVFNVSGENLATASLRIQD
jgi:hypothetical protein